MASRSDLHAELRALVDNVYFKPPPSTELQYPCVLYRRDRIITGHANNLPYSSTKQYTLTVITRSATSVLPDEIAMLARCAHERHYRADGLFHDIFTLLRS